MRFSAIENYSAKALYTVMAHSVDYVYTSSFNGLFDRMMDKMRAEGISGTALLAQVGHAHVREFVSGISLCNRLNDFLMTMPDEDAKRLLSEMVKGIDQTDIPVDQAAIVADIIGNIADPARIALLWDDVKKECKRVIDASYQDKEVIKTYGILASLMIYHAGVLGVQLQDEGSFSTEYPWPNQEIVKPEAYFNSQRENIQQYFFYDDRNEEIWDGHESFQHMLNTYGFVAHWDSEGNNIKIYESEEKGWHIEKESDEYVVLSIMRLGKKIKIYANKPTSPQNGPNVIKNALAREHEQVSLVIHRGHSYHRFDTMNNLPNAAKLLFLGSCGGFGNEDMPPNILVMSTKGTGTMVINDAILSALNNRLLAGKTFAWFDLWNEVRSSLKSTEFDDFEDYQNPASNIALLFHEAFKSNTSH
jgi:hypothetical protein